MANAIRDRLVQLERTLERLFGGQPAREPLEVRRAVVDAILGQVQPVARGRRVLPFDRITVAVVAAGAAERRVFREALEGPEGVEADVRLGLARQNASSPPDFTVAVRFVKEAGKDWGHGARFHVTTSAREAAAVPETVKGRPDAGARGMAAPAAELRSVRGQSKPRGVTIEGGRVSIGRQPAVVDQQGRVVRRNELAFIGDDEASRSVSRAHGFVEWHAGSASYRVYDENSSHGTQVSRKGRLIRVPPGRDGIKLQSGDEIHAGQAVIRFEVQEPEV